MRACRGLCRRRCLHGCFHRGCCFRRHGFRRLLRLHRFHRVRSCRSVRPFRCRFFLASDALAFFTVCTGLVSGCTLCSSATACCAVALVSALLLGFLFGTCGLVECSQVDVAYNLWSGHLWFRGVTEYFGFCFWGFGSRCGLLLGLCLWRGLWSLGFDFGLWFGFHLGFRFGFCWLGLWLGLGFGFLGCLWLGLYCFFFFIGILLGLHFCLGLWLLDFWGFCLGCFGFSRCFWCYRVVVLVKLYFANDARSCHCRRCRGG